MVQKTIAGAFPKQDDDLEALVTKLQQTDVNKKKASDKRTSAYDLLKEAMREKDLETYYCYTQRVRVCLTEEDAKIKLEKVKDEEGTPYAPKPTAA